MDDHSLLSHYDAIWTRSAAAVQAGDIELDTQLRQGPDPRRGLTVIARPDTALAARCAAVLDTLDRLAQGQYRHPVADLHLTVLSLSTVRADYDAALRDLDAYREAARSALAGMPAFDIAFRGITASRGAVLAQGYPCDATLETLRERLRHALRERGLDASLDERYRLVTAHITLLRFVQPLAQPARFAEAIDSLRTVPLGEMKVEKVALVQNDWYMSRASLRTIETFDLP